MSDVSKLYVLLNEEEYNLCVSLYKKGEVCPTVRDRLHILLCLNTGHGTAMPLEETLKACMVSKTMVYTTVSLYAKEGMEGILKINRNPGQDTARTKVTGREEAQIIAIACSDPPEGHCRWTLNLLVRELRARVQLELSPATVSRVLKNNKLRPHKNKYWCIPTVNGKYLMCMEDILDVYERPYNPLRPVVCLDEKPYQLLDENLKPLPMEPGSDKKIDYEYVREGVVSIFTAVEPHTGRCYVDPRERRTAQDFARVVRHICDHMYPEVEKIILVLDNLNTHNLGYLYETFPPQEAHRLKNRLEIHYTPVHASWLNIAEIEINSLTRMCLDTRIPNFEKLTAEVKAWEAERNGQQRRINWQFTTEDARIRLKSLYPTYDEKTETLTWPKKPKARRDQSNEGAQPEGQAADNGGAGTHPQDAPPPETVPDRLTSQGK